MLVGKHIRAVNKSVQFPNFRPPVLSRLESTSSGLSLDRLTGMNYFHRHTSSYEVLKYIIASFHVHANSYYAVRIFDEPN